MGFLKIFKSKTVWSAIAAAAFNIGTQVAPTLNPGSKTSMGVNAGLALATILFRTNPSQAFGGQAPAPKPQQQ